MVNTFLEGDNPMTPAVDARLFAELVAVDSISGSEDQFADLLIDRLRNLADFICKDDYGNVYAYVHGKGEPLFLAAHMDTVAPGIGIKATVKDGYIVSDGSTILGADNKAAIFAYISLLEYLKSIQAPHLPIEFVFTRSEEIGNFGAINFDYSLLRSKVGYCFDSVSPIGTVITASPFYERIDINLIGKSAHASKPEEARNVLNVVSSLITNIPVGRINDTTLCNIGRVEAGHVRNTIPGNAELNIEIRSYIESDLFAHMSIIETIVGNTEEEGIVLQIDHARENPGYYHSSNLAKKNIALLSSLMSEIGITPIVTDSMAVSDANIFNNKGILCINLGDGVENAHSVNERIAVNDIELMMSLCTKIVLI